jgi:hypothetical protein
MSQCRPLGLLLLHRLPHPKLDQPRLGDDPRFRVSIRISAWIIPYRSVSILDRSRHRSLVSCRPLLSLPFTSLLPLRMTVFLLGVTALIADVLADRQLTEYLYGTSKSSNSV